MTGRLPIHRSGLTIDPIPLCAVQGFVEIDSWPGQHAVQLAQRQRGGREQNTAPILSGYALPNISLYAFLLTRRLIPQAVQIFLRYTSEEARQYFPD